MRQKIGTVFLLLTILCLVTAINIGSWWWLGVFLCTVVTLWGIGFTSSDSEEKSQR